MWTRFGIALAIDLVGIELIMIGFYKVLGDHNNLVIAMVYARGYGRSLGEEFYRNFKISQLSKVKEGQHIS